MGNIVAILKKELKAYFVSPVAYVVLAVFYFVVGFFFYQVLAFYMSQMPQMMQSGQAGEIDMNAMVMRNLFSFLSTLMLFFLPMITMPLLSEEKKRGTFELLLTSPLTRWQIVLGKFFSALAFFAIMLLPTFIYSVILYFASDPHPALKPIAVGYLGLFLLGGAVLALGLFLSSLTENQIVSAVLTFGLVLMLWVLQIAVDRAEGATADILQYLSILSHFEDFAKGVLDTKSLVFLGSLIATGLALTASSIESLRWRE
ncbi:MAG: ABC transporter permease subunit [Acidobacteriota bacterium]